MQNDSVTAKTRGLLCDYIYPPVYPLCEIALYVQPSEASELLTSAGPIIYGV